NGLDPHFWLDPQRMLLALARLSDILSEAFPEHAAAIAANHRRQAAAVTALDQALAAQLAPLRARRLLVQHGGFAYLAERYGLVTPVIRVPREGHGISAAQPVDAARRGPYACPLAEPGEDAVGARRIAARFEMPLVMLDPLFTQAETYE